MLTRSSFFAVAATSPPRVWWFCSAIPGKMTKMKQKMIGANMLQQQKKKGWSLKCLFCFLSSDWDGEASCVSRGDWNEQALGMIHLYVYSSCLQHLETLLDMILLNLWNLTERRHIQGEEVQCYLSLLWLPSSWISPIEVRLWLCIRKSLPLWPQYLCKVIVLDD